DGAPPWAGKEGAATRAAQLLRSEPLSHVHTLRMAPAAKEAPHEQLLGSSRCRTCDRAPPGTGKEGGCRAGRAAPSRRAAVARATAPRRGRQEGGCRACSSSAQECCRTSDGALHAAGERTARHELTSAVRRGAACQGRAEELLGVAP